MIYDKYQQRMYSISCYPMYYVALYMGSCHIVYDPGSPICPSFCPYGFGRFFSIHTAKCGFQPIYGQALLPYSAHIWPVFQYTVFAFFSQYLFNEIWIFLGTPFFGPEMDCFFVPTAQLLGLWGFTSANGSTFKPVKKVDVVPPMTPTSPHRCG